ncbi:MAG: hypothetical protein NXI04_10270 [Planctomycetaceae bacterium]|nr:hypothetical protein [Planctomycetaceae bacterium]
MTAVDWAAREQAARDRQRLERRAAWQSRLRWTGRLLAGVCLSSVLSCWLLSRFTHVSVQVNSGMWRLGLFTDHLGVNISWESTGRPARRGASSLAPTKPPRSGFDFQLARWDSSYTQCDWQHIFRNPAPRRSDHHASVTGHPGWLMVRADRVRTAQMDRLMHVRAGIRYLPLLAGLLLVHWLLRPRSP